MTWTFPRLIEEIIVKFEEILPSGEEFNTSYFESETGILTTNNHVG
jgi:hypothetical protein